MDDVAIMQQTALDYSYAWSGNHSLSHMRLSHESVFGWGSYYAYPADENMRSHFGTKARSQFGASDHSHTMRRWT
jgi:hypothetical protein